MTGPRPTRRGWPWPLLAPALALLAPASLGAQTEASSGAGAVLLEAGAGVLWEDGGAAGRRAGPALGLRVTLASLPVRPVLAAAFGRTELPSARGAATERSWLFLGGGAEVPLAAGGVELALGARIGAARRDDTLADGVASSPHWTPVGEVGLVVRGSLSDRWGWHASAAALRDDLLDTVFDPAETSGRSHATLTAGATLKLR